MLAAPFTVGASFYIFYALQPFLLELYGDKQAYWVAGLVAAIAALAQIAGGFIASYLKKIFSKRTSALLGGTVLTGLFLIFVSATTNFWVALALIFLWGLTSAALVPVRQAYLNSLIPSEQRATVLSFDSLMGSSGGIVIQPSLGKVADAWGYPVSYVIAVLVQLCALPFIYFSRREKSDVDKM